MRDDDDLRLIAESPLFDGTWYAAHYPDVAASGLDPAEHFLRVGARLARDPGPGFGTKAYLDRHPDVGQAGLNPLAHFEGSGRPEGPGAAVATPTVGEWVDVVVPVHDALDDVKACLRALARVPSGLPSRVLVVNDGSDAPTTAWLRRAAGVLGSALTTFELIEHPENKGYTATVNAGLRASRAPFVVLLNSDTVVTPFWLDGLVRCMRSAPDVGIAGPLSNAAGWQNVPTLFAEDGGFAVNALPPGVGPDAMAALVSGASARLYPRVPFVNGFCYMIRREVIDRIGVMDEAAFPIGYGEENDYSIRAQDAGFALAIADDAYVHHAKSRSFGTKRRIALSRAGRRALKAKHGDERLAALTAAARGSTVLDVVRARVAAALAAAPGREPRDWTFAQRVLFLLPGPGGDERALVRDAAAMGRIGAEAKVAARQNDLDRLRKAHADRPGGGDLFAGVAPTNLAMVAARFDVVVAADAGTGEALAGIVEHCPWVLPARHAGSRGPGSAAPAEAVPIGANRSADGRGDARRALGDLRLLAPALARLREAAPRPERRRAVLLPALTPLGPQGRFVTGSGYVRVVLPYTQGALAERFDVAVARDGALPAPGSAGLAIIQRDLTGEAWPGFVRWRRGFRAAGGRVIYEVDDDLLDAEGLVARGYDRDPRKLARRVEAYAAAADVVAVSTPELASRFAAFADKIRVVPNYIDDRLWRLGGRGAARPARARPKANGQVRVGYMGTATHYADLELVGEAVAAVQARYGEALDVEVIGGFEKAPPLFGTRLALPRARAYPDFARWVQEIADWDVAIIPLVHDRFNLAKSDLKFIETAALTVGIVCSDVPTYRAVARHGANCLLAPNTTEGWVEALRRMIEDAALRRRLADAAHRDVASRMTLQRNADLYLSVLDGALEAAR